MFNISGMAYSTGGQFEACKQINQGNHTYTTKSVCTVHISGEWKRGEIKLFLITILPCSEVWNPLLIFGNAFFFRRRITHNQAIKLLYTKQKQNKKQFQLENKHTTKNIYNTWRVLRQRCQFQVHFVKWDQIDKLIFN